MIKNLRVFGLVVLLLITGIIYAQPPQAFKYKGVPRDKWGRTLVNRNISLQISILSGSETGITVYQETHQVRTSAFGVVDLDIGRGVSTMGNFESINWGSSDFYLKVEVDRWGGTNYSGSGVAQLLSVPYALYAGNVSNVDDADADPTNELQDISLSGTDLSISDGSTVDLSTLPDAVDDADADPTNEFQDLELAGYALSLSDDATPVDQAKYMDNTDEQQLTLTGQELTISGGNTVTLPDAVDDADADPTNEFQDLELAGDALSLSDDATPVDLAKYMDNTDEQQLTLTGQELAISGGNTVTLPDAVEDADADPTNELQDISLSGTDLSISEGSTVDLSTLPDAVDDADADPTNELQSLSLDGNILSLSDGGSVTLPSGSGGGSSGSGAYAAVIGDTDVTYPPTSTSGVTFAQMGDLSVEITLASAGEVLITYHASVVSGASGYPNASYVGVAVEINGQRVRGLGSYHMMQTIPWDQIQGSAVLPLEAGTHQIRLVYTSNGAFRSLPATYRSSIWGTSIGERSLTVKEL